MSPLDTWRTLKLFQQLPDPQDALQFHDSTFTRFPNLPPELRKMIWDAAIESVPIQTINFHMLLELSIGGQPSDAWPLFQAN
jgi:2EXR family